jgi:egghead protein (zeste-white 4 protein)
MGSEPVGVVFRFVTRGENAEVLRESVQAVHRTFGNYPSLAGPYRIEIITERPIALEHADDVRVGCYVVPKTYVTPQHSRFKARALTYLQEVVPAAPQDWYVYLDEESTIQEAVVAGIYRFIRRSLQAEAQAHHTSKQHSCAGFIGQGAIVYQGGHWFFRGADALRTADDFGRFRLQYALGLPLFGVHGSYLVVRGRDDARLSFDVGSGNSITEDAAWALRAWSKGFRFAWVDGCLQEQPPQRIMDFIQQRSRWLSGLQLVVRDTQVPLRYRLCLGLFTLLWQLASLPWIVAVMALFVHISPFVWMRLPAAFSWATFVLAYFQGIDVLMKHTPPSTEPSRKLSQLRQWWMRRVLSWLLVGCCVWYSLLEAAATIYSLKPKQGFFVIQKPSFSAAQEAASQNVPAVSVKATRRLAEER